MKYSGCEITVHVQYSSILPIYYSCLTEHKFIHLNIYSKKAKIFCYMRYKFQKNSFKPSEKLIGKALYAETKCLKYKWHIISFHFNYTIYSIIQLCKALSPGSQPVLIFELDFKETKFQLVRFI